MSRTGTRPRALLAAALGLALLPAVGARADWPARSAGFAGRTASFAARVGLAPSAFDSGARFERQNAALLRYAEQRRLEARVALERIELEADFRAEARYVAAHGTRADVARLRRQTDAARSLLSMRVASMRVAGARGEIERILADPGLGPYTRMVLERQRDAFDRVEHDTAQGLREVEAAVTAREAAPPRGLDALAPAPPFE